MNGKFIEPEWRITKQVFIRIEVYQGSFVDDKCAVHKRIYCGGKLIATNAC